MFAQVRSQEAPVFCSLEFEEECGMGMECFSNGMATKGKVKTGGTTVPFSVTLLTDLDSESLLL